MKQFTEAERDTLEWVLRGEPYRPPVSEVPELISEVSKRSAGTGVRLAMAA